MTSTDLRTNSACANAPRNEVTRRKAVLFCPVCGHESPIDGDWNVIVERAEETLVCPVCEEIVASQ